MLRDESGSAATSDPPSAVGYPPSVVCRLLSAVCRLSVGGPSPQGDVGVVALAVARGEACAWLRGDARGSGNGGGAGVRFVALFKR